LSEDAPPASPRPTEDLEDLYENAPCGYLSIEPNGHIFKVNATLCAWLGFTADELTGKRLQDVLNIAGRIFYETHFAPLLRMQGFFNEVALDLTTRDGVRVPVLLNAAERRDASGKHLFTRLTVFNATDRRRYERELINARATAEQAQKESAALNADAQAAILDERETAALREQFIAVLGHDLRNPLAAIDAGMRLLLRHPSEEKAAIVVQMVKNSVARMAELIDNIMDFARGRLGSGLVLSRDADEAIEIMLRQVITESQVSSPDHTIEADIRITASVNCDRRRVAQLLSNLLGNAVTHGDAAQPIRVGAASDNGMFELFVANGGRQIPSIALVQIFEPFKRGDHRPNMEGLGLGLYISHEIAKAHGGTLTVTSTPAETCFTFRMPATAP
jgi:sigma-B regulation protein RsbU (phosphoserine phosphatase)